MECHVRSCDQFFLNLLLQGVGGGGIDPKKCTSVVAKNSQKNSIKLHRPLPFFPVKTERSPAL